MYDGPLSRSSLEEALAPYGLRVRGGLIPQTSDGLPLLPESRGAAVIWMVGQVGSECWKAFSSSSFFADGQPDPMDRWSKSIGNALALQWGGIALYPSDGPPYFPFQQWAERAAPVRVSPLMLQIDPEYGLWHAYRFALLLPAMHGVDMQALGKSAKLADSQAQAQAQAQAHTDADVDVDVDVCLACDGQPCLSACPVDAFAGATLEVAACAAYLHSPKGIDCTQAGCQARRACPVGTAFKYAPEHAKFHMAAFVDKH